MAEALAILRGLQFVRESGLWPCIVDSDSQVVVSLINFAETPLYDIGLFIADILELVRVSLGLLFNFVPRNAYRAAHCLAKIGLSLCADNFWMEEVPPSVAPIVVGDRPRLMRGCPPMASYRPKNILITGAAGFIASHVCNRLIRNNPDYKIVVLDKLDYCSNLKNLLPSKSSPNFKFVEGDIGSADLVNYLLITESIDTIMHFAAQTHVNNSFGNSFEFTKNNIYGTHVLLEACKMTGQLIKRFIHVSIDEVYGETDEDALVGNHEASQLLPTNPYSATKAGAEMLVMAYGRSYGLPLITTRGNNVYGPNQFPEKLIPKFILLTMRGLALPIHRDGSNVRSYLYCEDVAEAFEVILHKGEVGHVYNIGTKKERRVIDSERTTWEEGLRKTMDWYIQNPDWWGDVSGALLPHPRMLMVPSGGRHFDGFHEDTTYVSSASTNTDNNTPIVVPVSASASISNGKHHPTMPSYQLVNCIE
ncbi:hypothetical protein EZV62_007923 [Acer yangbiense]|uniref:NAD(P)-binding domain-containing protein n=1 Tax=Acer yangbiense TaxID=1000413 RepID=A0A5C7IC42_9ROSI|nr:hypothetical protein EZV62_007923 [Acer yangbiense]